MAHYFVPSYGKRQKPIRDRIQAALIAAGGRMAFCDLADAVYPDPDSHRSPSRGGPPGCYFALSAAIYKHHFATHHDQNMPWCSRMVFALKDPTNPEEAGK